MSCPVPRRSALLAPFVLAAGCASLPAEQAAGTPAEAVARESAASVMANGVVVGAAVCVQPGLAVTNAHVVRAGMRPLALRGARGEVEVAAIRVMPGTDLALLRIARDALRRAPLAALRPARGETLWAVGPEGLGRAVASGPVLRPEVRLPGYGRGFTARLGALIGFSGGPVVNRAGEVTGLTTAMLGAAGAGLMAGLVGVDVGGFASRDREVFVLEIAPGLDAGTA